MVATKKAAFGPLFLCHQLTVANCMESAAAWYANFKRRQLLPIDASITPRPEHVETPRRRCHLQQTEVQRFDQIGEYLHRHRIGDAFDHAINGFAALRVSRSKALSLHRTTALQDAKRRAQPTLYHSHQHGNTPAHLSMTFHKARMFQGNPTT